jgi:ATP-dependent exoDNAse (exonuclease V) beta subunit
MSKVLHIASPDQAQRVRALDHTRSVLVRAPAGSGKTDLLTRRFLRLLGEVDDPSHIVAITFTKAAAAEMRHRILSELEKAAADHDSLSRSEEFDEFAMPALAGRAIQRSQTLKWNLLDLPAQLRISTIDSFCRELALQQPLLSGLGGNLDITEQPADLYRRAARSALEQIETEDLVLGPAIERLLLWRDNGWQEMESLLVTMLAQRDRWMQEFWLRAFDPDRESDWDALRARLERPFVRAIEDSLTELSHLLEAAPGACDEAMALARFACAQSGNIHHRELAELADFPCGPFTTTDEIEEARQAYSCLAQLLLTAGGTFRKSVDIRMGFPPHRKAEKQRIVALCAQLEAVPDLQQALAALRCLPLARYTDDEWQIVRACFVLLRRAVAELHVVFAEAGRMDFTEIAQRAQRVLVDQDQQPTDAALAIAEGIHHLLVDEFQDTSRRQHRLIASLVGAWPDTIGRTVFVVGDPMQSIYSFRDADAELFPRVQALGLEVFHAEPHVFEFAALASNFRTAPALVETLNECFAQIFAINDGSGVVFSRAEAARAPRPTAARAFDLHLDFIPQISHSSATEMQKKEDGLRLREAARTAQTQQIVALIRSHMSHIDEARQRGDKYRIAVLGRTRSVLAPIAQALREAAIPFRAVDLEPLADRPEVLDVLALARALFNPEDRVAWLGVLRAPWCGLSLAGLYLLTSADDPTLLARPLPELLRERANLLTEEDRNAVARLLHALAAVSALRAAQPTASLGTWLEQIWQSLGGADCVDETARANLDELWSCLDQLSGGEADLLGRGLTAALENLTAQANPAASSECGVQLMTIHKAKGLEFEVVIVPELQAGCGRGRGGLLSWLERGLERPDESDEITEFLVAPLQPKGEDRGKAKEWVDRVYRRRESQETRRILYVAATRAREELHLFARPTFKTDKTGALCLCEPPNSLLSTAWPALEQQVQARFEEWKRTHEGGDIISIAASAGNLLTMPSPVKPTMLRRLPPGYQPSRLPTPALSSAEPGVVGLGSARAYSRHEGGLLSREFGSAVHSFFEELARLRISYDMESARSLLQQLTPRITAQVRSAGVDQAQASRIVARALDVAIRASHDANAAWILSPHASAASEVRWAGVIDGNLRIIQVDRVFQAGQSPQSLGQDAWWIIDYKTAHADDIDPEATLPQLRASFAPQLELYAHVLRNLHGAGVSIRAGLYYPRMLAFDAWEL